MACKTIIVCAALMVFVALATAEPEPHHGVARYVHYHGDVPRYVYARQYHYHEPGHEHFLKYYTHPHTHVHEDYVDFHHYDPHHHFHHA